MTRRFQPFDVTFANRNGIVVVECATKDADRPALNVGITDVGGHAVRVERQICDQLNADLFHIRWNL